MTVQLRDLQRTSLKKCYDSPDVSRSYHSVSMCVREVRAFESSRAGVGDGVGRHHWESYGLVVSFWWYGCGVGEGLWMVWCWGVRFTKISQRNENKKVRWSLFPPLSYEKKKGKDGDSQVFSLSTTRRAWGHDRRLNPLGFFLKILFIEKLTKKWQCGKLSSWARWQLNPVILDCEYNWTKARQSF